MIKKLKNMLVALAAVAALGAPALVPAMASAQSTDEVTPGLACGVNLDTSGNSCTVDSSGATDKVNSLLKTVINIFSIVVGVVAVIMIIIGGLKYITSGGDSGNVSSAKNTIIYALVGLVVVALAQFIVRFVLGKATGVA